MIRVSTQLEALSAAHKYRGTQHTVRSESGSRSKVKEVKSPHSRDPYLGLIAKQGGLSIESGVGACLPVSKIGANIR